MKGGISIYTPFLNIAVTNSAHDKDKRFLVVRVSKEHPIALINYQVEMIFNNPSEFIVPFEVIQQNDDLMLQYDISAYQTLRENIKTYNLTLYALITLLIEITTMLIECQQFFLDETHFILDENFIYMKQGQERLRLIYLPFQLEETPPTKFRQFITKLIYESVLLSTTQDRKVAENIIKYVKVDELFTQDFNRFLHIQRNDIHSNINSPPMIGQTPPPIAQKAIGSKLDKKRALRSFRPFTRKMLFFFVLCQFIIIGLASKIQLLCDFYHLEEKKNILIALFVLISNLLVFKALKRYQRRPLKNKLHNQEGATSKSKDICVCKSEEKSQSVESQNDIALPFSEHDKIIFKSNYKSIEETVLLYGDSSQKGYLIFDEPSLILPYCLEKPNTIIGRNALFSDLLLQDRVIGRVHAEIITRDQNYYLIDKKSKNSTYLNDERILPDSELQLHHLDKIIFGNIPCTFVIK